MADAIRQKLVLAGSGSASGGVYQEVKITGEGQVFGNLDCTDFRVHGTSRVDGNVKSRSFKIYGTSVVVGNVDSDQVHIYGTSDIGGDLSAKRLKLYGSSEIGGSLTGDDLRIGGEITIQKDCEAEIFSAKGGFTVGGLLNAGTVHIQLFGPCSAREIGGDTIKVTRSGLAYRLHELFHALAPRTVNMLSADTIEGDSIYLEYTKAKVVRGSSVHIGPGCEIEYVEYKEHFEQANGAIVNSSVQL
ncbi:polymer-forming cytoskeletal protein [Paenibacillus sp. UNC451MF]|uniref:polymer-forming cytoskeletal protein n=1 Tax=Paenibacillus sp. UNC451MF TaxID=1449063 RepID=UPI00048FCF58|nr:polymer-forming cytoskeletal protein [Paenibacillus sp. UNC451MF]